MLFSQAASLHLGGVEYDANIVLALAKSGPKIAIDVSDINAFDSSWVDKEHKVSLRGNVPDEVVVLFKQHGKYTVLMGMAKVREALEQPKKVVGRLISTPALKRAKVERESVSDSSFKNTPRLVIASPNKLRPMPTGIPDNHPDMERWRTERNAMTNNNFQREQY